MRRLYRCLNCNTDDGPIAFSTDAWCSDHCHKQLAEQAGVQQFHLSPEVVSDVLDYATEDLTLEQFFEEIRYRVDCNERELAYEGAPTAHETYVHGRGPRPSVRRWKHLRRVTDEQISRMPSA